MGFTLCYRSTRSVTSTQAAVIKLAAAELSSGRSWLSCEPVCFFDGTDDGHLCGGSKQNFQPHPLDATSAAASGEPDGTTRDLIDALCELSRMHDIDWEISHEYSDGPIGYIRNGVCDSEVLTQSQVFADVGDMLGDMLGEFEEPSGMPPVRPHETQIKLDDDEDGPHILKLSR